MGTSTGAVGDQDTRSAPPVALALAVAIIAISFAAPFFRKAAPTPPLVAAGLRLAMAAVILTPLLARARARGTLTPALLRAAALAGAFYGLHFGAWVWSLTLTSVAASVTLVTATPLLLALWAWLTGRDRPDRRLTAALALAAVGVALIGGADLEASPGALAGDALALLGSAAMGGYLLVGRRLGPMDVGAFQAIACGVGALSLLGVSAALGLPLRAASPAAWGWLALATAVPQLVGHTLLTWSLRHTTPTVVAMATVAEPVGATALAWLWLGDAVAPLTALGCALTLAAVLLALRRRQSPPSGMP
ncbi:MAG: DMT family transporter [Myxococcales bacterium]|nr:DMT family transporter [Myxococcales bacterium]